MSIPPFTDARRVVDWAREAEATGWDGVFLWDHVQWRPGAAPHDSWVLLGALALVGWAVDGPQIAAADRRRAHSDQDLPVTGLRDRELPDLDLPVPGQDDARHALHAAAAASSRR